MENSEISWTHHTFNPWQGCTKVSDGCKFCYAETLMDHRYGKVKWGPQGTRVRTSESYWKKPYQWNRKAQKEGIRFRVFCASLADVFEDREELTPWRADLFEMIDLTPSLDWLLLTKRPENVNQMIKKATGLSEFEYMYNNVWIGTSVEDQESADKRVPELLKIPARIRFLSAEPLLGPIYLAHAWLYDYVTGRRDHAFIDWVIVGGESGPKARPMHPSWARSLGDQCRGNIPFHFKQWGEYVGGVGARTGHISLQNGMFLCGDKNTYEWGEGYVSQRVGKHAAGRILDGQVWDEFP